MALTSPLKFIQAHGRYDLLLNPCVLFQSVFDKYYDTVYERSRKNMFWSMEDSGEVLSKLKSRGFRATSLSTYDSLTL